MGQPKNEVEVIQVFLQCERLGYRYSPVTPSNNSMPCKSPSPPSSPQLCNSMLCMCIKYNTKKRNHLVKCKIKETTHIAVASGCQEESVMHMSYIILKGIYLALEVLEVSHKLLGPGGCLLHLVQDLHVLVST